MMKPPSFLAGVFVAEDRTDAEPELIEFHGSATLIGGGFFITARHVIAEAIEAASAAGATVVLLRHGDDGLEWDSVVGSELPHRTADVAVGAVRTWRISPPFSGVGYPIDPEKRLSCIGFPGSLADVAVVGGRRPVASSTKLRHRVFHGNVTRQLDPGEDMVDSHSFELSFILAGGMSGAPVYEETGSMAQYALDSRALHGIVTGTSGSSSAEHSEQYGVAAALLGAADRPLTLTGGEPIQSIMMAQLRGIGVPIPEPVVQCDDAESS